MASHLPLPKYHQVYLSLREQLNDGCFAEGLPGEMALMRQFGVARVTVRRALEQMASEGLIHREPGKGTRLAEQSASNAPSFGATETGAQLTGLLENLVSMSRRTSVRVLDVQTITASARIAFALNLTVGDSVQKAVRVRSTAEGPLSHITTYVPGDIGRKFGRRELAKKPILVLLEDAGIRIGRAQQSISARLADMSVAEHLGVAVGSALLAVRRLVFDENERPVQWLHGLYRPDRYEYVMQLSRVGEIDAKVWVSTESSAQYIQGEI